MSQSTTGSKPSLRSKIVIQGLNLMRANTAARAKEKAEEDLSK